VRPADALPNRIRRDSRLKICATAASPQQAKQIPARSGERIKVRGGSNVGAHANGEEALRSIPGENPDVVLMDINLPGMSGIECVARLKQRLPQMQVLMLTTYEESDLIFDSLRSGTSGYLLKNMPPAELVQALEQVHAGGSPRSMNIARKVVNHFQQIKQPSSDVEKLTKRETRNARLARQRLSLQGNRRPTRHQPEHRAGASARRL